MLGRALAIMAVFTVAVGLVVFAQTSAISANPLYLALNTQYSYAVINVINVTYLGLPTSPDLAYYTLYSLVNHVNVTIELYNVKNGSTLYIKAWIPQELMDRIYLAPNISSAFFVIAVADSNANFTMNPYVFGDLGLIYNVSGKQVNQITVIPLGLLKTVYNGQVINVENDPVFQSYLADQNAIDYAVVNNWEGIYIIYVST
ncbi:MAG: hypothetical protein L7H21_05840 [Sulfolobales archaeon]|nr:hypothetical protein [Sulfolobales archaeon]MCG2894002.1 hypothetical protein [Sulfolobales archaeon]MCG2911133.1 hypothetical protein [Sulfolobales archaeon]